MYKYLKCIETALAQISLGESQNYRMAWVGRDLKDHESPTPLPHEGPTTTPLNTRTRCPWPQPIRQ